MFGAWEVVDNYTVKAPFGYSFDPMWATCYLNSSCQSTVYFSKAAYDQMGSDWMRQNIVSTGPMQVVEWMRDDRAILEAVPTHWRMQPQVSQLRFLEVPEEASRIAMLRTGEADVAEISLKNIGELVDEGFAVTGTGAGVQMGIFYSGNLWETEHALTGVSLDRPGLHPRNPWIGDPDDLDGMEEARQVRWALAEAIDREGINETVLDGLGWPEYVEYCQAQSPYFDETWRVNYDLASARDRLQNTGWPNGFEIPLYVGPQLGGGAGTAGELGDAVAGHWQQLDTGMSPVVLKFAYPIFRPGLVERSTTIPWLFSSLDEGTQWPFDWPKGMVMTSLTRGGFGCGVESPEIAQWYLQATWESDPEARIAINTDLCDYLHYWQLGTGVIGHPVLYTYNPNSIGAWPTDVEYWGAPMFDAYRIVPAGMPAPTPTPTPTPTATPTPVPVIADFSGSPRTGDAPLTVQFTDLSTGEIELWAWDFDSDGVVDSTEQNPSYEYATGGDYTVTLTVTGPAGSDTERKIGFVRVTPVAVPSVVRWGMTGMAAILGCVLVLTLLLQRRRARGKGNP